MFICDYTGGDINEYDIPFSFLSLGSGATIPYQVAGTSYDSKSFSLASQDTQMRDAHFNADGTKMYANGVTANGFYQYSLSTAYDVSTASYDSVSFLGSEDGNMEGFCFNSDGTKIFGIGLNNFRIYQYTLSTAFDLSTMSYSSVSLLISGQDNSPRDVGFNNDGTKMFLIGRQNDSLHQYSLSTAFDLSTASYDSVSFSVASQETNPSGFIFSADGTKLFVTGTSGDDINGYNLSTAFDITTAVYNESSSALSQISNPQGLVANANGTKMYIVDNPYPASTIYQYSTTGLFASTDVGKTINANSGVFVLTATTGTYTETTAPTSYATVSSGNWGMFGAVYDATADVITVSSVTGAGYNLTVAAYTGNTIGSAASYNRDVAFNNDGTKMYQLTVVNTGNGYVNEWDLSTPYSLVGLTSAARQTPIYSQENNATGLAFSADGTKMFTVGTQNKTIYLYNLSTAFNVTTATYSGTSHSFAGTTNSPQDITFSPDGTWIYLAESQYGYVYPFPLSTGFDITTIGSQAATISAGTAITGFAISNDGTKGFVINTIDGVTEYTLPTAFLLNSAVAGTNFGFSGESGSGTSGIAFSATGSSFIVCSSTQGIWEYTSQTFFSATGYQPCISSNIDSTYWTDLNSLTATNAVGDGNVFYAVSNDNRTEWSVLANAGASATFAVTVANAGSGNRFYIDGVSQNSLTLTEGQTYKFDQSSGTNSSHPLRFSTTSDGTHGGGSEYTTGVTTVGTPGSSGAYTQIVVAAGAPTLYYYCTNHSGMGGTIITATNAPRDIVRNNGGTWQYNSNGTYASETWVNATTNTEAAALRQAMEGASSVSGYGIAAAVYVEQTTFSGVSNPVGLWFSPDGTKMYILDGPSTRIYEYNLSTAFKPSTYTYVTNQWLAATDSNQTGVVFNSTGTKMFTTGLTGIQINEYALSTAFAISSFSHTRSLSVSAQVGSPQDLTFNTDGTKMFVLDSVGDDVNEYTLSTGFNISTASFVDAFSISGQETSPTGLWFNSDGTQMFIVGTSSDTVFAYTLTTGFDVSSASYSGTSFSIAAKETSPSVVAFDATGSKMYVGGSQNDSVIEYTSALTNYTNQMNSTTLNAITDANQITLGNDLDFAAILYYASGSTSPTYSGTAINYDANILNQGAVLGTDYNFDAPAGNKVRITAVGAGNFKVRVV